jgi:hypothetical protein
MSFTLFDATWGGGETFGYPTFWTGAAFIAGYSRNAATAIPADAQAIADAVYNGVPVHVERPDGWIGDSKHPYASSLVLLDFETGNTRAEIVRYLEMFRSAGPNLRVGYFPFAPFTAAKMEVNRDDFQRPNEMQRKYLSAAKAYTRPIVRMLDCLTPDCYLLHNKDFERDLRFMVALAKYLRSYDCPVYPFMWGVWHDAWNPPITLADGTKYLTRPNTEQMRRYVETAITNFDGAVVWGRREDNVELIAAFKEAGYGK